MSRYKLNKNYFNTINTHEKAYWLGFLSADGSIMTANNKPIGVCLELSTKDIEHLENFRNIIGSNSPIKDTTHRRIGSIKNMCRLRLCSVELGNDLLNLGLTHNKKYTLQPPEIPNEFINSYILGYFDGDGSIWFEKNGYKKPRISFTGTYEVISWISNYLSNIDGVNHSKIYKGTGNCYRILYGGRIQIKCIENYMYKNSYIFLKRKKELLNLV